MATAKKKSVKTDARTRSDDSVTSDAQDAAVESQESAAVAPKRTRVGGAERDRVIRDFLEKGRTKPGVAIFIEGGKFVVEKF